MIEQLKLAVSHALPQLRGQRIHIGAVLESEVGKQPAGDRVRQRLMPRLPDHVAHPGILAAITGHRTDVIGVTA